MGQDIPGAQGANGEGASGTQPEPTPTPQEEPQKSINSQAKELKWVIDLQADSAELARLKAEQADAQSKAEREKAEAEGRYQDALKMEQDKNKKLEQNHQSDTRHLRLELEFFKAGIIDDRAVLLFENDYNPETESAQEFVSRIKADERNTLYFSDPKKSRTPGDPPPASGIGGGENYDPSWIKSKDPKKRAVAIERNRKAFWEKFRGGSR